MMFISFDDVTHSIYGCGSSNIGIKYVYGRLSDATHFMKAFNLYILIFSYNKLICELFHCLNTFSTFVNKQH